MTWFKDLFTRKDSQAESLPAIPEKKPNISEPVISFVETFKANPKRFKVVKNWDTLAITICIHSFTLKDKYNNLEWEFKVLKVDDDMFKSSFDVMTMPIFEVKREN